MVNTIHASFLLMLLGGNMEYRDLSWAYMEFFETKFKNTKLSKYIYWERD